MKKKIYIVLYVIAIILIIGFGIFLNKDWLNYNEYMSTPFYVYVFIRIIEFLIPSIICFLIATLIKKKTKKN